MARAAWYDMDRRPTAMHGRDFVGPYFRAHGFQRFRHLVVVVVVEHDENAVGRLDVIENVRHGRKYVPEPAVVRRAAVTGQDAKVDAVVLSWNSSAALMTMKAGLVIRSGPLGALERPRLGLL